MFIGYLITSALNPDFMARIFIRACLFGGGREFSRTTNHAPMPCYRLYGPGHLSLSEIKQLPALFQPRALAEHHVHQLVKSVKSDGVLDPVKVVQIGSSPFLVDGHHRVQAYRRAGYAKPIPVVYFTGSIEDAVLEAGRENSKDKLPMTGQERQDYAWRLVKMGTYTAKEVQGATTVSVRQVANMREVLKKLGPQAESIDSWWRARKTAQQQAHLEITDDELEERLERQAQDYANKIAKACSTKLARNPTMAARVLDIYFGRKLSEVIEALQDRLADADYDDEKPDF